MSLIALAGLVGMLFAGAVAQAAITMAKADDQGEADADAALTDADDGAPELLAGRGGIHLPQTRAGDSLDLAGWEGGERPARIVDFDTATEEIVVLYDPLAHPDPVLTFFASEAGMTVLLDGLAVAELPGISELGPEAVRLVTEAPLAA